MNCINGRGTVNWHPNSDSNNEISREIVYDLKQIGLTPAMINNQLLHPCNLLWYMTAASFYKESKKYIPESEYIDSDIKYVFSKYHIEDTRETRISLSGFIVIEQFINNLIK
jgi:hypothetical protein